jgi:hypothetical protein
VDTVVDCSPFGQWLFLDSRQGLGSSVELFLVEKYGAEEDDLAEATSSPSSSDVGDEF